MPLPLKKFLSGKPITIQSPAKVNLRLKITGRRKDGYHTLDTIFQMISLYDEITFTPLEKSCVRVTCNKGNIPQRQNLAYHAAKLLYKAGMGGVHIHIQKNIPSGAGLGGGSSNAATVLHILNQLWQLNLPDKKLRSLGLSLGADVPFFLFSPRARGRGVGEKLSPLPVGKPLHILLVKPRVNAATAEVYAKFASRDNMALTTRAIENRIEDVLSGSRCSYEDILSLLDNDLTESAGGLFPVIKDVKQALVKLKCKGVVLSGSGSATLAVFSNAGEASKIYSCMKNGKWWCRLTKTIGSMGHLTKAI